MKERMLYCLICVGLLILGIVYAVNFSNQYVIDFDVSDLALANMRILNGGSIADEFDEETLKAYENISAGELIEMSQIIIKARPNGIRSLRRSDVLSEVVIEDVLKGDKYVSPGQTLKIYEPVYINSTMGNEFISFLSVNNMMQTDKSYILLLKPLDTPDGYSYSRIDGITYIFVNYNYGVYPVFYNENAFVINDSSEFLYRDAQSYDNILYLNADADTIKSYRQFRSEILKILWGENL